MTYENICKGIFLNRPNRFIAQVEIDGTVEICHVKNTGRCRELLIPGTEVYVNHVVSHTRSTAYDLIAVYKNDMLVNIDSYAPNLAFGEYLRQGSFIDGVTFVKAESKYGGSRFDFYVETAASKAFIEVKGVTLEENGVAMFPDAPTERGVKHLNELAACIADGYDAYAVFVIQMKGISRFTPNYKTHQAFGDTLAKAANMGVNVCAFDCVIKPDEMVIDSLIPIEF
jgi:sugar fermentation stimulation protein A